MHDTSCKNYLKRVPFVNGWLKVVRPFIVLAVLTVMAWVAPTACQAAQPLQTMQISRPAGGGFDVLVSGTSGQSWRLLTSTNLTTWLPLSTNHIGSGGTALFHDSSPAAAKRFYQGQLLSSGSGGTITALSPSYADVSSAIAQATNGSTVVIPAGSAVWVNQSLTINKSITLQGAGTAPESQTRIQNGNEDGSGSVTALIKIQLPSDLPVCVSGIYFDNVFNPLIPGNGYQTPNKGAIRVNGSDYNGSGTALTRVRIDHNTFNKGKMAIMWSGFAYGLTDHNTFTNADIAIGLWADDNFSWLRPIVPGTTNTVVIEDNVFTINNNNDYEANEQIYHQEGARSTIRHNTFDGSTYTAGESYFLESHGNVWYYSGITSADFRGQPLIEVYNNTFHGYKVYRFTYFRGGSILVHDNVMTAQSGGKIGVMLSEEEDWLSGAFSPLRTTWPAEDQINNSFFWNNTVNGSLVTGVSLNSPDDSTFIQINRDYWMKAPDATTVTTYPNPGLPSLATYPNRYTTITSYKPLVYPHPMAN